MGDIIVYRNPMEKAFWDGLAQYPVEIIGTCVVVAAIIIGYCIVRQMWRDRVFHRKYHQAIDRLLKEEKEGSKAE